MGPQSTGDLNRDEGALTAVIEFLSAFTLFLMILVAFMSLASLQMGPNDPGTDRLDSTAVNALDRLLADEGQFIPYQGAELDYNNSTSEWHTLSGEEINEGRVLPGLLSTTGGIDIDRVTALRNVTETGILEGLAIPEGMNLHLTITVIESNDENRTNLEIFSGGTPRLSASSSTFSMRMVKSGDELVRVLLEIHNGGKKNPVLEIHEVSPRGVNGGPEWFELYNPSDFAEELSGWSFESEKNSVTKSVLLTEGVMTGGSYAVFTGDPNGQDSGNASEVIDLGSLGFLGVGAIDGLADGTGSLKMYHTQQETNQPSRIQTVQWGGDTGLNIGFGESLVWDGNSSYQSSSWTVVNSPTPGN